MIELDHHVVDARRHERGEKMFDGFHGGAGLAEHRGMLDARNFVDRGGNFNAEVGAAESDAGICGGRFEGERHLLTGMQPDACARDLPFDSSLSVHPDCLCSRGKQRRCPGMDDSVKSG